MTSNGEDTFSALCAEAVDAQRQFEQTVDGMSAVMDPGGLKERLLMEHLQSRDIAVKRLGFAVLAHVMRGGRMVLEAGNGAASADLRTTLLSLGEPGPVRDLEEEVRRLHEALTAMQSWSRFTKSVQHSLLGYASSKARHLQAMLGDGSNSNDSSARLLHHCFRQMTQYSRMYRPGWVAALSTEKGPENDSWMADARGWWRQLDRAPRRGPGGPDDVD